jgi:NitT/TauT family transport system ATP-binding protein
VKAQANLPRPRDVAEIRLTPGFVELHREIWHTMRDEVMKGYARSQNA